MGMGAKLQYQGVWVWERSYSTREMGVTVIGSMGVELQSHRYWTGVIAPGGMGMELQYQEVWEWSYSTKEYLSGVTVHVLGM